MDGTIGQGFESPHLQKASLERERFFFKVNKMEKSNNNNLVLGIICILLASLGFGTHGVFVRLAGDLPLFEKTLFRNLVTFFIALPIFLKTKHKIDVSLLKANTVPLIVRAIGGTLGIFCNYYALTKLNIADATMLNKMSPFFALIFSVFILKEKPNFKQLILIIIAFVGALFVIKPTASNVLLFPSLIGLIGGIGAGIAYTCIRYLSKNKVDTTFIVLFFSLFSIIVNLPLALMNFKPMSLSQLIYLLLAGIFASLGQFGITYAYKAAPAKEISVYDYSQVIFSAIMGYLVFKQMIDGYSLLGYVIIISSGIMMFFINKKKSNTLNC